MSTRLARSNIAVEIEKASVLIATLDVPSYNEPLGEAIP